MYLIIKRVIDLVLSCMAIFILSPVILIIAICIKLDSPGPILFRQKRIGRDKKSFYILKFRTMKIDTPQNMPTHMLENPEQFITKIGIFLRRTSLDELPQLLNIILGEMAIIGPRPALWNQYDLIEEREKYGANSIPVGLTGWAQINGRDELDIFRKAELDGEYAKKISILFDAKCFIGTIFKVVTSEGIIEGRTNLSDSQNEEV